MSNVSFHPTVKSVVELFYKNAQIDREIFQRQVKQSIRKDYDSYILPFKLSNAEKKTKTHFPAIIEHTTLEVNNPIHTLPTAHLEAVLILEPPKRVIQYQPPSVIIAEKQKPTPKVKQIRVPKQPKVSKRALQEVASIYADEVASLAKRAKVDDDDDDEAYVSEVEEVVTHNFTASHRTPDNFDQVAGELFEEFWNMEIEEQEVSAAFFARITAFNCRDYKLANFAETSSSLAVIKDKLANRLYFSVEDFVYDFHQMFANIFKYYPESHPAYLKAQEMSQLFEARLTVANQKFR